MSSRELEATSLRIHSSTSLKAWKKKPLVTNSDCILQLYPGTRIFTFNVNSAHNQNSPRGSVQQMEVWNMYTVAQSGQQDLNMSQLLTMPSQLPLKHHKLCKQKRCHQEKEKPPPVLTSVKTDVTCQMVLTKGWRSHEDSDMRTLFSERLVRQLQTASRGCIDKPYVIPCLKWHNICENNPLELEKCIFVSNFISQLCK